MEGTSSKILIVDEKGKDFELLSGDLKDAGFILQELNDPKQTIEVARRFLPDVIMLEINILDIFGLELCRFISKDEELKDIFVIFISPHEELVALIFDAGGSDFLVRPLNKIEVVQRINNVLKWNREKIDIRNDIEGNMGLVRMLSNDISNPLMSIHTFMRRLRRDMTEEGKELDQEKAKEIVKKMDEGYKELTKLTTLVKELFATMEKTE